MNALCNILWLIVIDANRYLFSDAEVTTCKYKWLIISVNAFVLGYLKWLRWTVGGRKIYKNLQILLPSKKENANICKIDFPVLCTFTLFNADFCRFLQSLWSEWSVTSNFSPFRYIYLCSSLYIFVIWRKFGVIFNSKSVC